MASVMWRCQPVHERTWRRLDGSERLTQVIEGVRFRDGEPVQAAEEPAAA